MLSINGLHNFYYLPELHDMRCKAQRICEIIRGRYHRDPLNGDVYMFMSKDQRKVRMIHYERNAYYLHEKSFIKGYKFMKIERKDEKPYRKGMRYNKECVGTPIIHKSDYTMLPEGSVVISSSYRKIRNIMSHIEEHHFEVLKVKHADGRIESMFLPMKDDARASLYDEIVPGTSITANMLSYLMFNRFQMSTPACREVKNRLSDRNWNTSPQNLLNWADKGAMQLNKLIPALKKIALQDGVNPLLLYMYLDNELMDRASLLFGPCKG